MEYRGDGPRKFLEGMRFTCDGQHYRVAAGSKSPNDLKLEWHVDGWWRPVRMQTGFFLADFFYENEDVLRERYPGVKLFEGGEMYQRLSRVAGREGYEVAQQMLAGMQARRQERDGSL